MRTLIDNGLIITGCDNTVYQKGCVLVDDGRIVYVGEKPAVPFEDCTYIDAKGGIVMPGLINTHNHSPMSLLRGIGSDKDLNTWLYKHIFPCEAKLDEEAVYYGSLLSCAEMIKSGTTAFADMYFISESIVRAALTSGMRLNISHCVTDGEKGYKHHLKKAQSLFTEYNGAGDGRILVEYSAHAVYTCSLPTLRAVANAAKKDGTGVHVHLSETMKENRDCYRTYGKSPTEIMEEAGLFDVRANAAHCIYLSEQDMDILKNHTVSISHNPTSNLKLASGVANIKEIMDKEINVSLGTDGPASNNTLDMFFDMKLVSLLHKGMRLDPTLIPAAEAFKMATANGAKTLGRGHDLGKLKEGYRADIIILDSHAPSLSPLHDPVASVVYGSCGAEVVTSMINGELVMLNRELLTIDLEATVRGAQKVLSRIGLI